MRLWMIKLSCLLLLLLPVLAQGATIILPETGQTTCYDAAGAVIACAGTGQDGDVLAGAPWPDPRFTDNGDGTITDNLTGLIWLANANCFGTQLWATALSNANALASGACGLTDGSAAGDWRLPNPRELFSLVDRSRVSSPPLPVGYASFFSGVQSVYYWSSSTYAYNTGDAWFVSMLNGFVSSNSKSNSYYVWPVRGGQSTLTFDVSPSAGANGSMTPATVQTIDEGQTTSFEIAPDAGYAIDSVGGTCGGTLVGSTYTTAAVTADCTVTASFVELDTDGDGTPDSTDLDDDNDGVSDIDEAALGTDPLVANAFVPKTGQTTCYDAAGTAIACADTGQDGDIQAGVAWPDPRFTDNGDGTVTDNLNGLVWAKDATTPTVNTCTGGALTWQTALDYVECLNLENYQGYSDWVLPNLNELKSLIDVTTNKPILPSGHLFDIDATASGDFWSSNTNEQNPSSAWYLKMSYGFIDSNGKTGHMYVLPLRNVSAESTDLVPKTGQSSCFDEVGNTISCVGTGQDGELNRGIEWPATRFNDNADGSVTDSLTGLTWLKNANCIEEIAGVDKGTGSLNWANALIWSNALADGYCDLTDSSISGDWRLPNQRELDSLTDLSQFSPSIPILTNFVNVQSLYYWTSSSYTLNPVNVWYHDMLLGRHSGGNKPNSAFVWPVRGGIVDKTPPAVPSQIEANDLGVGEVLISWTNPTDTDFDHIVIYRSTVSGQLGSLLVDNQTGQSYVDSTVAENVTYYYTVRSVDEVGNESTNTEQVSVSVGNQPPSAPTDITATDAETGGQNNLSWTNPGGDFACINLYRSTGSGVLGDLILDCIVTNNFGNVNLTNGVTYYYTVRSEDTGGLESSNTSQVFATPTLAGETVAPAEVTFNPLTDIDDDGKGSSITLNWTAPALGTGSDDLNTVVVYRKNGATYEVVAVFNTTATTPATSGFWTDTDVQGCTTYEYKITTIDDSGNESTGVAFSHLVTDTSPVLPVTGLTVTPLAGYQMQLDWTPSASVDANCYTVYGDNGGGLSALSACLLDPASTFTTAVLDVDTEYDFVVRTTASCGPSENNTNTVAATTTFDPNAANNCVASIKVPKVGHTIGGNSVTIIAEATCYGTGTVTDVQFEYSTDGGSNWIVMSDASGVPLRNSAGFPNPDTTAPYFVHWDVSGVGGPVDYLIRAVSDTDLDPGSIAVTIDNSAASQASEGNNGNQQKTEDVYQHAPSNSFMGNEDGITGIELPEDALDGDTEVVLKDLDTPPLAPPSDYDDLGNFKDIHFGNGQGQLNYNKKAKVTLSYTDNDDDGFVDGTNPPISIYDLQICNDHDNTWTCLNSTVDQANKRVKALVDKFSTFGLLVPPKLSGNGLTMVAVPLHATPNDTASVLGSVNQYGTYAPVWNPTTSSWITYPGVIEPGKGYFIWANGNELNVNGDEVDQTDFTISLYPGWNMMGNPFRYGVDLTQLQVNCGTTTENLQTAENNGWVIGTFFHYVNGSWQTWSVQDLDTLPTWKGLYILSDQTCTLTIPAQPSE